MKFIEEQQEFIKIGFLRSKAFFYSLFIVFTFLFCLYPSSLLAEEAFLGFFAIQKENSQSKKKLYKKYEMSLFVNEEGKMASIHGFYRTIAGRWSFDREKSVLSIRVLNDFTGEEEALGLEFNREERSFLLSLPEKKLKLDFISEVIPDYMLEKHKKFALALDKELKSRERERRAKKAKEENPEYKKKLLEIKNNPKIILSNEFHQKRNTPAYHALESSLKDRSLKFDEELLVALFTKLGKYSPFIEDSLLARPEISESGVKKIYSNILEKYSDDTSELPTYLNKLFKYPPNVSISFLEEIIKDNKVNGSAFTLLEERKKKYKLLQIEQNPRLILSKDFLHQFGLDSSQKALEQLLENKDYKFDERLLVEFLSLPYSSFEPKEDSYLWSLRDLHRLVFTRSELSSETLEKLYPIVSKWKYRYELVYQMIQHPNVSNKILEWADRDYRGTMKKMLEEEKLRQDPN